MSEHWELVILATLRKYVNEQIIFEDYFLHDPAVTFEFKWDRALLLIAENEYRNAILGIKIATVHNRLETRYFTAGLVKLNILFEYGCSFSYVQANTTINTHILLSLVKSCYL